MTADRSEAAPAAHTAHMPRWQAAVEVLAPALLMTPALIVATVLFNTVGLTGVAFPPLGVYLIVGLCTVFLWRRGETWAELGLRWPKSPALTLGLGVLTALVIVAFSSVLIPLLERIGFAPPDLSYFESVLPGNTVLYTQLMLLVVWGSAGIGEEMFARGFLLNRMERLFAGSGAPTAFAIGGQAVVFGLAHAYQGPTGMIAVGVIGVLLGVVYVLCGRNLLVPILAHGLFDSFGVTAMYLGYTLN